MESVLECCNKIAAKIEEDYTNFKHFRLDDVANKKIVVQEFLLLVEELNSLNENDQQVVYNFIPSIVNNFMEKLRNPASLATILLSKHKLEYLLTLDIEHYKHLMKDNCGKIIIETVRNCTNFKNYICYYNNFENILNRAFYDINVLIEVIRSCDDNNSTNFITRVSSCFTTSKENIELLMEIPLDNTVDLKCLKNWVISKANKYKNVKKHLEKGIFYIVGSNINTSDVLGNIENQSGDIYLESQYALHIDSDLLNEFWHGRTVCLKTNRLIVHGLRNWDLSGINQNDYQANSGNDEFGNGNNGKDGDKGEDSGHIMLKDIVNVKNLESWSIMLNGGDGQNGQNGTDGVIKDDLHSTKMTWNEFQEKYFMHDENEAGIMKILDNIKMDFPEIYIFWNNQKAKNFDNLTLSHDSEVFIHAKNLKSEEIIFSFYIKGEKFLNPHGWIGKLCSPSYKCYVLYKCNKKAGGCPGRGGFGGLGGEYGQVDSDFFLNVTCISGKIGEPGQSGNYPKFKNDLDFGYIYKGKNKICCFGNIENRYLDIQYKKPPATDNSIKCRYRKFQNFEDFVLYITDINDLKNNIKEKTNVMRKTALKGLRTGSDTFEVQERSNIKALKCQKYIEKSVKQYNTYSIPEHLEFKTSATNTEEPSNTFFNEELDYKQLKILKPYFENTLPLDSEKFLMKYKFSVFKEICRETSKLYEKTKSDEMELKLGEEIKKHEMENKFHKKLLKKYFDNDISIEDKIKSLINATNDYILQQKLKKFASDIQLFRKSFNHHELYRNKFYIESVANVTSLNLWVYEQTYELEYSATSNFIIPSKTYLLQKVDNDLFPLQFDYIKYLLDRKHIDKKYLMRNAKKEVPKSVIDCVKNKKGNIMKVFLYKFDTIQEKYFTSGIFGESDSCFCFLESFENKYMILEPDHAAIYENAILNIEISKEYLSKSDENLLEILKFNNKLKNNSEHYRKEQLKKLEMLKMTIGDEETHDGSKLYNYLLKTIKSYNLPKDIASYEQFSAHCSKDFLDLVSITNECDIMVFEDTDHDTLKKIYATNKNVAFLKQSNNEFISLDVGITDLLSWYKHIPDRFIISGGLVSNIDCHFYIEHNGDFNMQFIEKIRSRIPLEMYERLKVVFCVSETEENTQHLPADLTTLQKEALFMYIDYVSKICDINIYLLYHKPKTKQYGMYHIAFLSKNKKSVYIEVIGNRFTYLILNEYALINNCCTNTKILGNTARDNPTWNKIRNGLENDNSAVLLSHVQEKQENDKIIRPYLEKELKYMFNEVVISNKKDILDAWRFLENTSLVVYNEVTNEIISRIQKTCNNIEAALLILNRETVVISDIQIESIWLEKNTENIENFYKSIFNKLETCQNAPEMDSVVKTCEELNYQINNITKKINKTATHSLNALNMFSISDDYKIILVLFSDQEKIRRILSEQFYCNGKHVTNRVLKCLAEIINKDNTHLIEWILASFSQIEWLTQLTLLQIENSTHQQIPRKEHLALQIKYIEAKNEEIIALFALKLKNNYLYAVCEAVLEVLSLVDVDKIGLCWFSEKTLDCWFEELVAISCHDKDIIEFISHVESSSFIYVAFKIFKTILVNRFGNVSLAKLLPVVETNNLGINRSFFDQIFCNKWKFNDVDLAEILIYFKKIELKEEQLFSLQYFQEFRTNNAILAKYRLSILESYASKNLGKIIGFIKKLWSATNFNDLYLLHNGMEDDIDKSFYIDELRTTNNIYKLFPENQKIRNDILKLFETKPFVVFLMLERFEIDGLNLTEEEIMFVVSSLLMCFDPERIVSYPQSEWIAEVTLLVIREHVGETNFEEDKMISLKRNIMKIKDIRISTLFCTKLRSYDKDVKLRLQHIAQTIDLITATESSLKNLNYLDLYFWKYQLTEYGWAQTFKMKENWDEYKKYIYYAYSLDIFASPAVQRNIRHFFRKKSVKKSDLFKKLDSCFDEDKDFSIDKFQNEKYHQRSIDTIVGKFRIVKQNYDKQYGKILDFAILFFKNIYKKRNPQNTKNKTRKEYFDKNFLEINGIKANIAFNNLYEADIKEIIEITGGFTDIEINFVEPIKLKKMFKKEIQIEQLVEKNKFLSVDGKTTSIKLAKNMIVFHDILRMINKSLWPNGEGYMRNNQLFTIFLGVFKIRNTFFQLASGEGKSLTIACISIIRHLLFDEKIHIISSSKVLAERDAMEFEKLYTKFGVTVGHNCDENKEDRKQVYAQTHVVYGYLGRFQNDYLLQNFYGENIFGNKMAETVFVDEVDNVLIDNGNNMLYLSKNMYQFDKLEGIFLLIWRLIKNSEYKRIKTLVNISLNRKISTDILKDIYPDNVEYLWENLKNNVDSDGNIKKLPKINSELHANYPDLFFSITDPIQIPKYLNSFVQLHLETWIKSAFVAKNLKENSDYVIDYHGTRMKQDKTYNILIITKDTGADHVGSEWDEALHQFLQIKHNLSTTLLNLKSVFISNLTYIKQYKKRYGFTGTLGTQSEKQFLSETFDVDCFNILSFKKNLFTEVEPKLCSNNDVLNNEILQVALNVCKSRALLILCETILDVDSLTVFLLNYKNNQKPEDFKDLKIIKREKEWSRCLELNKGCVLISTNLSGRGSDIKISDSLSEAGGLHVCMSYLPSNIRVEQQGLRRAARKGQKGSGGLIFRNPFVEDFNGSVYDLKRKRDVENEYRLLEIQSYYENHIQLEEQCLELLRNKIECIKNKLELGSPKFVSILLDYCLNQWAFKLDKISYNIKNVDIEKTMTDFVSDLESSILNIQKGNFTELELDPIYLIKFAVENIKMKNYNTALAIVNHIIEMDEPQFSEAAHYYKAFILSKKIDWFKMSVYSSKAAHYSRALIHANKIDPSVEYENFVSEVQSSIVLLRQNNKVCFDKIDSPFHYQKLLKSCVYMVLELSLRMLLNPFNLKSLSEIDPDFDPGDLLVKIEVKKDLGKLEYFVVSDDWKKKFETLDFKTNDVKEKLEIVFKKHISRGDLIRKPKFSLIKLESLNEFDSDGILATNGFYYFFNCCFEVYSGYMTFGMLILLTVVIRRVYKNWAIPSINQVKALTSKKKFYKFCRNEILNVCDGAEKRMLFKRSRNNIAKYFNTTYSGPSLENLSIERFLESLKKSENGEIESFDDFLDDIQKKTIDNYPIIFSN